MRTSESRDTSNFMILVPLWNPKFATDLTARRVRTSGSGHWWGCAQHCLRRARAISIRPRNLSQVQFSATFRSEHSGSEHSGRMAMNRMVAGLGCALVLLVGGASANAQGTVKIGLINVLSGQFADAGIQLDNGVKTYMKQHGDTVA